MIYILYLISVEVWYSVDDHPGYGAAEVDDLVHYERHDAGRQDIVLHERVPCCPQSLEVIQVDIVFRYLIEIAPIGLGGRRSKVC